MTYDEMQTGACNRAHDLLDGILWAVSEIRRTGVGCDRATDLFEAIKQDAGRAAAINARITNDDLDEALATGDTSSIRATR
jgi:hypothetical protein